jgi:hypothetical protein
METGRQRKPGRRSSEEKRAGMEPGAKINQLGEGGAGTEIGRQRQPGRRTGEAQMRKELETELRKNRN